MTDQEKVQFYSLSRTQKLLVYDFSHIAFDGDYCALQIDGSTVILDLDRAERVADLLTAHCQDRHRAKREVRESQWEWLAKQGTKERDNGA